MNEYMSGLYRDANGMNEEPNGWSQMLMSLASTNNSWSAEQAQKQMEFQERMSNTAHQREVEDLKASGLNPVLSAKLGGASTPSGASATADSGIIGAIVGLMDKMLDVETSNAQMNLSRELAAQRGSGNSQSDNPWINIGNAIQTWLLDKIPGVSQKDAKNISGAIMNSGGSGFWNWIGTGNTSSGTRNNFQTPMISKNSAKNIGKSIAGKGLH